MSRKKKRIKIMIQDPNRRTYFRKGPIVLHVSDNQELENYGKSNKQSQRKDADEH